MLDQIRDVVLHKKGNETLLLAGAELNETNNGSAELVNFFNDIIISQANKLGGMLLKTYDSDIFNNWVKTDWIDGVGGMVGIMKPIRLMKITSSQDVNGRWTETESAAYNVWASLLKTGSSRVVQKWPDEHKQYDSV